MDENAACAHIGRVTTVKHAKRRACEECLKIGASWVHLRVCQECGATLSRNTSQSAAKNGDKRQ